MGTSPAVGDMKEQRLRGRTWPRVTSVVAIVGSMKDSAVAPARLGCGSRDGCRSWGHPKHPILCHPLLLGPELQRLSPRGCVEFGGVPIRQEGMMEPCNPQLTGGTDPAPPGKRTEVPGQAVPAGTVPPVGRAGRSRAVPWPEPVSGTSPPPYSQIKSPFSCKGEALLAGHGDIPGDTGSTAGARCPLAPGGP